MDKEFMIELEKNTYKELNENCRLCHIAKWGDESKYFYAIAIKNSTYCDSWGWEIYGYGDNSYEALVMAVSELTKQALKGISFETISHLEVQEFYEKLSKKEGNICSPEIDIQIDAIIDGENHTGNMNVIFEDEKCYPFLE